MGNIYLRRLQANGWNNVRTIDPKPEAYADFQSLSEFTETGVHPAAWVVATPNHTHVDLVRSILQVDPTARILVEKPVGSVEEVKSLAEDLHAYYPLARVVVSDLYGGGSLADKLREACAALPGDAQTVEIEMTKNRIADEASGRFVCKIFGDYGYEWFHVIRLLEVLLPSATFAELVQVEPDKLHGRCAWTWRLSGLTVMAASRVDGIVALPGLFLESESQKLLDSQRFRRIRVATDCASLRTVFDEARTATIWNDARATNSSDRRLMSPLILERSDAVVQAVVQLLEASGPPADAWMALAGPTHQLIDRLRALDRSNSTSREVVVA